MPFNREWDPESRSYIINRDLTGPPPPPDTGVIVEEDGTVVADSDTVAVPPATPVKVTIPGPRERVIDAQGNMTPRWRRFFEELYRRTGAIEDNINSTSRFLTGVGTTGSIAFASDAPSVEIDHNKAITGTTLTITGAAPTVS